MEKEFEWEEAKKGNEWEIERIVNQYYRLAFKKAYSWIKRNRIDLEEGLSLASLALMKCIRGGSYDTTKGKFSTYVGTAVDNEIRMHLRKKSRRDDVIKFSIDEDVCLPDGTCIRGEYIGGDDSCFEFVEDMIVANSILKSVMDRMSELEGRCIELWLTGMSQRQVAEEVGMSQSYVSRLIRQGRRKLREESLVYEPEVG